MKQSIRVLAFLLVLATLLVSACGAAAPAGGSALASKVQAAPVEFTGVIEALDGNQWTINGQTITVDPAVIRDGPFTVGDTVRVEANVQTDGSIVVTRVETPQAADTLDENNSDDGQVNDDNGDNNNNDDGQVNDDEINDDSTDSDDDDNSSGQDNHGGKDDDSGGGDHGNSAGGDD